MTSQPTFTTINLASGGDVMQMRVIAVLSVMISLVLAVLFVVLPRSQAPPIITVLSDCQDCQVVATRTIAPTAQSVVRQDPAPTFRATDPQQGVLVEPLGRLSQQDRIRLEARLDEIDYELELVEEALGRNFDWSSQRAAVVDDPEAYVYWSEDEHTLQIIASMDPEAADDFVAGLIDREEAHQHFRLEDRRFWITEDYNFWSAEFLRLETEEEEILNELDGLPAK